jgi:hypothetical protein
MTSRPSDRIAAHQDGNVTFFAAEPDDLDTVVSVPQAFDNQWLPTDLLRTALARHDRPSDEKIEAERRPFVRSEYFRSLVNTGQVVINRAFLYNNPAIFQDYQQAGRSREDFKTLITRRVIIPFLLREPSPATPPAFGHRAAGWEGWTRVIKECAPTCLRFSWESDEENTAQARRLLSSPTAQFLRLMDELEPPLLAAELQVRSEETETFARRLREVTTWAQRRASAGEPLNREDVYKEFVVIDGTDPDKRQYDPGKPFSAAVKQLIDLRYNANLADALGSYLLSPQDSLRRRALQEWRRDQRGRRIADGDYLAQVVANLHFDRITEVLGAPAAFDQLTLGGVLELRETPAWEYYHSVLRDFLAQPTLEDFNDEDHGAEAVAMAYRRVIEEAGPISARNSQAAIQSRWDPIVEITVEFAGAVVSVFYNPGGDGGKAFRVVRGLTPGIATRGAKAVFHLIIGRATRARSQSNVENGIRVLETNLDHGRRDWDEFIKALGMQGFTELSAVPEPTAAVMERSTET